MRTHWLLLAVSGLLVCSGPAQAEDGFRKLGAPEIRRTVPGMEFTDAVHWAYFFQRGGRLGAVAMGRRGAGRWRQDKDRLCLTRSDEAERCYEVWRAGERVQLREDGPSIPEEGILQRPSSRS
ncbi:hypothetical protein SLNSH_06225 [Alsobacter soli]|uniref:DUF995 domain-containing protein n=1 Tax=Alsobacter soli TaxID=2109933 RepID=A0A2T1HWT3_9HYPH|nr:hypothetical protein [Alsobacter soli]PSC05969.1 hypothetical protein SLNSH_06225 [Alsobacter soli]